MADWKYLLGDDVHLLAGPRHRSLYHCMAIMGAHTLGLGQLVTHDLAWQCGVQRLASALLALVTPTGVDFSSSVCAGGV